VKIRNVVVGLSMPVFGCSKRNKTEHVEWSTERASFGENKLSAKNLWW